MKFGDKVTVTAILNRKSKSEQREKKGGWAFTAHVKYWQEKPIERREGLLIGFRTLSNGRREWESEEGYIFIPEEYFKAALVVFSEKEKPVLAPISALCEV